jgi:membrane-associated phospholipid phosphatase
MRLEPERPLPHEILFGAFLCVMWLRLALAGAAGGVDAMVFLALIAVNLCLILVARKRPGRWTWMARLLYYPIAMNVVFQQLRTAIPAVHPAKADLALQGLDRHLVGGNLSLALQPWVNPVATEVLSFCYLLFFPYLLFSLVMYFAGEMRLAKKFCVGLFSLYGIGFLGYSLVPAVGPYIAMADQFSVPLAGWKLTEWNDAIVRMGSNGVDVFPSLHCAVSSFFLAFDFVHRRWRFWVYLVPAVGLWISTIYLRYHYFVDLVAGFALAALAIAIASRYERGRRPQLEGYVARS